MVEKIYRDVKYKGRTLGACHNISFNINLKRYFNICLIKTHYTLYTPPMWKLARNLDFKIFFEKKASWSTRAVVFIVESSDGATVGGGGTGNSREKTKHLLTP